MKLISILIVLLIEHFLGSLEDLRRLSWFRAINRRLQQFGSRYPIWQGPVGVLVTLAIPMSVVGIALYALDELSAVFSFCAGLFLFLYSIGPRDPRHQVAEILHARHDELSATSETLAREFIEPSHPESVELNNRSIAEAYLLHVCERLFSVILWFLVLGPLGALLFRLTAELRLQREVNSETFQTSCLDLYAILDWLPARLLALTYALSGSLTHALDAWQFKDTLSLHDNRTVLIKSGIAALQFDNKDPTETDWLNGAQELVVRALYVWLTILAIMTLAGWLG